MRTSYGLTETFPITTGILQGDVLAPYLFVMVLDRILSKAIDSKSHGILLSPKGTKSRGLRETRLTNLNYADDLLFFSDNKADLQSMIEDTAEQALSANLRIAVGPAKTAWMQLGRQRGPDEMIADPLGAVLKVLSYRYLGNLFHETEPLACIRDRLRLTWSGFSKFRGIWVSDFPDCSGDKELRMVTGKPDPSQTDLEVPRPTSSTSFRLSKEAPTCCCQHAAWTNCTSTRLTQEG